MGAFRKEEGICATERISPSDHFFFYSSSPNFANTICYVVQPRVCLTTLDYPSPWVTKRRRPKQQHQLPSTSCPTPSLQTSRMPLKESTRRAQGKFPPPSWGPS